jgi:hypothetical protein
MNKATNPTAAASALTKADPTSPALIVTGRDAIAIKAGTVFAGRTFAEQTAVEMPSAGLTAGTDYAVIVDATTVRAEPLTVVPVSETCLGGFHFAPGGNAAARSGGDDIPAINPFSCWDVNFRPACLDPRGMTRVDGPLGTFWSDIYLLASDHLANGTSRLGVTIADGNDPPENPKGGRFKKLDYATAVAVMAHHGKGLHGPEEFFAAAYGVTELTVHDGDPKVTKLDAPRTSKWGLIQPAGNLWQWGHDGDPDKPRASFFGGSWWFGGGAGSRCANVAYGFPDDSNVRIGARGRGDHLQLA